MPARVTMSFQIFCCLAMKAANSSGGPPPPTALSSAKRWVTLLLLSAFSDSSCSRLTISRGVPAGARMPYHCEVSNSLKPISATVGTSGSAGRRCGVPTAMARSLPLLMCGSSAGRPALLAWVRPASRSVSCGPVPR